MAKILQLGGRNRKLAAILHADVAGFSRLMGLDEAGTHRVLGELRRAVDPLIASYGGRIVGTAGGHSLLADFSLAPLNAVWMCGPNDGDHLLAPILCRSANGKEAKILLYRMIFYDVAISMKSGLLETRQHMVVRRLGAELRSEPLSV